MRVMAQQHSTQQAGAAFKRRPPAGAKPLDVRKRLAGCPTIKSFAKVWEGVQQVPAPSAEELVVFDASLPEDGPAALAQAGQQARALIDAHLLETGALLLRGLPITSGDACEAFVGGLGYTQQRYEPYGGVRAKIGSLDAATNVGPAELLDLHHEMCYNPKPNAKIMLICLQPAKEGGESLIGDASAIAAAMPAEVLETFASRGGVRYTRTYISADAPPGTTGPSNAPALAWQERVGTQDPEAAVAFFRDTLGFGSVAWADGQVGGTLIARHTAPAVVAHPVTGEALWFNLTHLAVPGWTEYADGSPISAETVEAIGRARLSATRALQLGAGDVLVLDNYKFAHGRLPYDTREGRTLVAVLTSD